MDKCPDGWEPSCSCSMTALEPSENCFWHGCPDNRQCPYCGQFRGYKPCKRCGCEYDLPESTSEQIEPKLGYCYNPICRFHERQQLGDPDPDDTRCLHPEHDGNFYENCEDFETLEEARCADNT